MIRIYTDGCCKKDYSGGWACIIRSPEGVRLVGDYKLHTTNNQMELMGVVFGLEFTLLGKDTNITIYSDSQYVVQGFNNWMHGWQKNNWTRKEGGLANAQYWSRLWKLKEKRNIKAKWVRGHSGHLENEWCDLIANYCHQKRVSVNEMFKSNEEVERWFCKA